MKQIKENIFNYLKSIFSIISRDIILQSRNLGDVFSLLTFFIIAILIFVFAIGPDEEQLKVFGISILWTILVLSSSITVNKSIKNDYNDGNLSMYQFRGISFEIIALTKIFTSWILFQLPLIVIMPIISLILNISPDKIQFLIITMIIGSPILTILMLIASAMMLTNKKNLILVSLIILPISIPIIIFSVGAVNSDTELFLPQIYILLSILLVALACGPWIISSCIKMAIKN